MVINLKYAKKQLVFFIVYLAAGALIFIAAMLWSPAGRRVGIATGIISGFLVTGIGGIFLSIRMMKNPSKAENIEIAKTEERTQFIRMKTHTAVNRAMLLIICIGTFAAEICGHWETTLTLAALLITGSVFYLFFSVHYLKKY